LLTKELHEKRKIGSSDAPIIMGVSPWKSARQLLEEKVLRTKHAASASMQRGIDLEEKARTEFERLMGVSVFGDLPVQHPEIPWMTATLDGLDIDRTTMVEIKCPNPKGPDHKLALSGEVPEKYYPQCQHQLAVTGLEKMYYFSFDGNEGVIIKVDRDDEYIRHLIAEEKSFYEAWKRALQTGVLEI
jgi:putative phage-type endonuclease